MERNTQMEQKHENAWREREGKRRMQRGIDANMQRNVDTNEMASELRGNLGPAKMSIEKQV